jgi:hypothetical protein
MPNVLLCAKAVAKALKDDSPLAESGIPACYETSPERLHAASQNLSRWPKEVPMVKEE